jgi:hypothetical protein
MIVVRREICNGVDYTPTYKFFFEIAFRVF